MTLYEKCLLGMFLFWRMQFGDLYNGFVLIGRNATRWNSVAPLSNGCLVMIMAYSDVHT